jgi:hypothetical protein
MHACIDSGAETLKLEIQVDSEYVSGYNVYSYKTLVEQVHTHTYINKHEWQSPVGN